jgi:Icc-related predicted phosphoesterase
MRFIAFSDFHGNEYSYENARTTVEEINKSKKLDFIVICGDLTTKGSPEAAQSLIKLANFPVMTYFIFGNMDYFDHIDQGLETATNLHLNPITIENCDLIGIGGDKKDIEIHVDALKKNLEKLHSELLIMISHVAPYKLCDLAYNDRNIGSKQLTALIRELQKNKKVLVCCGHVHEQWTCNNKLGNAIIWNVGPKGVLFEIQHLDIKATVL